MVCLLEGVVLLTGSRGFFVSGQFNQRQLSVWMFSLFASWQLAFLFQGQVLYALADRVQMDVQALSFGAIAAHLTGLFSCGFIVKSGQAAKRVLTASFIYFILASGIFFFTPSILWNVALLSSSFLAGICVAAWGFFYKACTPSNERMKTAAEVLIYSNFLMIIMNGVAIHLSPYAGLVLGMLLLSGALLLACPLSGDTQALPAVERGNPVRVVKSLAFLCLFIAVITINSGLMYQVINPAFAHHQWLVSWYWAVPYIVALCVMKKLPRQTNRAYILYVAIAMIGFAFIGFVALDRSAVSYLLIDTLMLGAYGVYDLFWWSILGEMLEFSENPATVFGIGLSANVLGVLLGGLLGNVIVSSPMPSYHSSLLALGVVCVTLMLLPPLHRYLTTLLIDHAYLTVLPKMIPDTQSPTENSIQLPRLTERENEIAALLLEGKTYRMIAGDLHLSENTVKTHVKNIYSKYDIKNRTQLINLMLESQHTEQK